MTDLATTTTLATLYRVWQGDSPACWEGWDRVAVYESALDEAHAAAGSDYNREDIAQTLSVDEIEVWRRADGTYQATADYDPDFPGEGWLELT